MRLMHYFEELRLWPLLHYRRRHETVL